MNTRINYLYRDAANYKVRNECVIQGEISKEQISIIVDSLMDGEFFKPGLVGLHGKTFVDLGYPPYEDDPEFFELGDEGDLSDSFELTNVPNDVCITAEQLTANFIAASQNGWLSAGAEQSTDESEGITMGGM